MKFEIGAWGLVRGWSRDATIVQRVDGGWWMGFGPGVGVVGDNGEKIYFKLYFRQIRVF